MKTAKSERVMYLAVPTRVQYAGDTCSVCWRHVFSMLETAGDVSGAAERTRGHPTYPLPSGESSVNAIRSRSVESLCSEPGGSACCYWNRYGSRGATRPKDAPAAAFGTSL